MGPVGCMGLLDSESSMSDIRWPTRPTIIGRHYPNFRNGVAPPPLRCSQDLGVTEPESEVVLGGRDTVSAWQADDYSRETIEHNKMPKGEMV